MRDRHRANTPPKMIEGATPLKAPLPSPLLRCACMSSSNTGINPCRSGVAASTVQELLEIVDFVAQSLVAVERAFDLANGMQHGRMIAVAETTADFR